VTSTLLRAEGLTAGYGKMPILHDVTLEVRHGEMVSVIGPNGAGKSTSFKTIVGFLQPTSGRVVFDGQDITGLRPNQVVKTGLAYVPQGRIVFPQMTVLENLEMGAYIERDARKIQAALERVFSLFPVLENMLGRRGGDLSGGQQQQLAIARALITRPRLLILDEPTEGIQPSIIKEIERVIRALAATGEMAILLVEQYYDFARSLADQYLVMERGEIVARGAGADMDRDGIKALLFS